MKKRMLALLLCFVILLGGTSCKNSKNEESFVSSQKQTSTSIAKTVNKSSVYWTPNGKSYHTTKSCPSLARSKKINNTTLKQAIEKGKTDPCNRCVKQ